MVLITIHQSDTIIVSNVNGSDERQCGTNTFPCYSIDYGLMHLTSDFMSQMIVIGESVIGGEISLKEMNDTVDKLHNGRNNHKDHKRKIDEIEDCLDVKMDSCIFDGMTKERNEKNLKVEEMCRWSGSLVDIAKSSVLMKDTTISNSAEGGITLSGGNIMIEKGEFMNNNPSIEEYPSLRRNIICSDSEILNMMSLKGGDGLKDNTSLWILNEGCSFEGVVSERDSSFFIPVLESVEAKESTDRMKLTFKMMPLVPCNLSFSVVKRKGDENEIEKHDFDSNGFLSEREVEGIRWRRAKNENKDVREIVNDEVKKYPKMVEMVTMEMLPEAVEKSRKRGRDEE
ncbi:uncharacterized protein MONOS_17626 [Monocercomonoides exilis]|uniref:uncharacterized protein n=1 Tax=Monocercomonoides exilis TaxID=2049356 RepID=UPI0035593BE4|nr:hypothetical protein MONOS_17626 [Monocercomonoides exilis]